MSKKNHTCIFIGIVYKTYNVRNHCLVYKPLIDNGFFKSNLNTNINFGRKKVCIHFKDAELHVFDYGYFSVFWFRNIFLYCNFFAKSVRTFPKLP